VAGITIGYLPDSAISSYYPDDLEVQEHEGAELSSDFLPSP
jgi:hypothetical protein